jgi:hypothetical protein
MINYRNNFDIQCLEKVLFPQAARFSQAESTGAGRADGFKGTSREKPRDRLIDKMRLEA